MMLDCWFSYCVNWLYAEEPSLNVCILYIREHIPAST